MASAHIQLTYQVNLWVKQLIWNFGMVYVLPYSLKRWWHHSMHIVIYWWRWLPAAAVSQLQTSLSFHFQLNQFNLTSLHQGKKYVLYIIMQMPINHGHSPMVLVPVDLLTPSILIYDMQWLLLLWAFALVAAVDCLSWPSANIWTMYQGRS